MGLNDTRTAEEAAPYGIDSNPIKDMIAVYSETSAKGDPVIIGYINVNQLADIGENRLYSTDENGVLKTFIWLKNDGQIWFGGNAKNMTRFQELESGFNQLRDDFNSFLTHVHGGSGTPPTPPVAPSTADISGAKIEEIKTL